MPTGAGAEDAGGSGGGIRLVSSALIGSGTIQCLGGSGSPLAGGVGRIRLERVVNSNTISVTPDPSVVDLAPSTAPLIWPPANAPQVSIVSINEASAPADPRAAFGTTGADVVLPLTNSIQVVVATTNVEEASQVLVRATPRSNGGFTQVGASVSSVVSTSPLVILWTANLPAGVGYSAVQARVIRP